MRALWLLALAACAGLEERVPKLTVSAIETRLKALQERVGEMNSEERARLDGLTERLQAMKRSAEAEGTAGTHEAVPAGFEATKEEDAEAATSDNALSARLAAIQQKIASSESLRSDPDVQAALKRVAAKFELAGVPMPGAVAKPFSALEGVELETTLKHAKGHVSTLALEHGDDKELMSLVSQAKGHISNLEASPFDDVSKVIAGAETTLQRLEADAGPADKPLLADAHATLERLKKSGKPAGAGKAGSGGKAKAASKASSGGTKAKGAPRARALEREKEEEKEEEEEEDQEEEHPMAEGGDVDGVAATAVARAREHAHTLERLAKNVDGLDAERTEALLEEHLPEVQKTVAMLRAQAGAVARSSELHGVILRTKTAVRALERHLRAETETEHAVARRGERGERGRGAGRGREGAPGADEAEEYEAEAAALEKEAAPPAEEAAAAGDEAYAAPAELEKTEARAEEGAIEGAEDEGPAGKERGEAATEEAATDGDEVRRERAAAVREAKSLERDLRGSSRRSLPEMLPRVQKLRALVHSTPALAQDQEVVQLLRSATQHLQRHLERTDEASAAALRRQRARDRVLASE